MIGAQMRDAVSMTLAWDLPGEVKVRQTLIVMVESVLILLRAVRVFWLR